jgi:hypothetical protein
LDFSQVPDHASRGEVEAPREFAALLQLVDRGVCERDDPTEFVSTDRTPGDKAAWFSMLGFEIHCSNPSA